MPLVLHFSEVFFSLLCFGQNANWASILGSHFDSLGVRILAVYGGSLHGELIWGLCLDCWVPGLAQPPLALLWLVRPFGCRCRPQKVPQSVTTNSGGVPANSLGVPVRLSKPAPVMSPKSAPECNQ